MASWRQRYTPSIVAYECIGLTMSDMPRVFISYARKDGEESATRLRKRLESEHPEITLWQDRSRMEGGVGWWKQITEALDIVKFMIIVMTPAAVQSEIARKEWRYARQQGVCVYPVKGVLDAELDYSRLPRWMSKAHFFDLGREWETFIHHLKSPPSPLRVPSMAPDLPECFVERPAVFHEVLSRLLDKDRVNPVAITTALQGAGGLGKTTLASALCHHEDVVTAFDDGILWVTLGEKPNVVGALTKLYAALTGERPGFVDIDDASLNLSEKLENKACLIVIDDVWDPGHLRPFLRGGKGCARLITTRKFDLAIESDRIPLDSMAPSEAVELLTKGLEPRPRDDSSFRHVAERLGEWPLLLELAAATMRSRVKSGATVNEALQYLQKKLDRQGVTAFDQGNPNARSQAFSKTIEISLEPLATGQRQRCYELGMFPEDTDLPLAVLGQLWRLDEFETEEVVAQFANLSLLAFHLQTGSVHLHDVVRQYLAWKLGDPTALHARLVEAWCDGHHLPHAYAWCWLGYHLVQAGRINQLRALLLDFNWLQAKLDNTDVNSLIEEFEYFSGDSVVGLLQSAVRLSAHVLTRDKLQLAGQLLARLQSKESDGLESLRDCAAHWKRNVWLRPLIPVLTPPGGPLRFTLVGHIGRVLAVAVTKDGQRAVSASDDHDLKIWDLPSGMEERTLKGHTDWVRAVAMTASGRQVVSCGDDHRLISWNMDAGTPEVCLQIDGYWPRALAVTPEGQYAILATDRGVIHVWDLHIQRKVHDFKGHTSCVNAVTITPDGRFVASCSDDRTLRIWDLRGEEKPRVLRGHTAKVTTVAVTSDGYYIATTGSDETLRLWEWQTHQESRVITDRAHWVRALGITKDGKRGICGTEDGTLQIWNFATGNLESTLEGHTDWVTAVALSDNGGTVVSASADRTLKVWNLAALGGQYSAIGHKDRIRLVSVSPDGNYAVSSSDDRTLRVWDLKRLDEIKVHRDQSHWPFALVPESRLVVSAAGDATITIWDWHTGDILRKLSGHSDRVRALVISPDGHRILSASDDLTIAFWDLEGGVITSRISLQSRGWVRCMAISPDGHRLATGAEGTSIKIWELSTGLEAATLRGHTARINGLAVTSNGRYLLSASEDSSLKVWDLNPLGVPRTLIGHASSVNGVAILNDSPFAVTASSDSTLKLWDFEKGTVLATFTGEAPFRCCAVGRDGRTIVAGDEIGRLHVLEICNGAR